MIPFTIGGVEPLICQTAPAAAGGADIKTIRDAQSQSTQENQGAVRVVLNGVAGAAIAIAVLALVSFLRRRRAAPSRPDSTDATDDAVA